MHTNTALSSPHYLRYIMYKIYIIRSRIWELFMPGARCFAIHTRSDGRHRISAGFIGFHSRPILFAAVNWIHVFTAVPHNITTTRKQTSSFFFPRPNSFSSSPRPVRRLLLPARQWHASYVEDFVYMIFYNACCRNP